MPKSSSASEKPSLRKAWRVSNVSGSSESSTPSVISSSIDRAATSERESRSFSVGISRPERTCWAETLTATLRSGQRTQSARAWRRASAPNSSLSPQVSASGTNTVGDISPRVGLIQRISASTPWIAPLASTCGW